MSEYRSVGLLIPSIEGPAGSFSPDGEVSKIDPSERQSRVDKAIDELVKKALKNAEASED